MSFDRPPLAAGSPPTPVLLTGAGQAFPRILAAIGRARRSIHINMFIWRDDRVGNALAQALLDAAGRGVRVTVSKDKLGVVFERAEENKQSFFHKSFDLPLWLRHRALDAFYRIPGEPRSSRQRPSAMAEQFLRHPNIAVDKDTIKGDHSKFYLIDEEVLILGGMNVEDKIFQDVSGRKWRDFMLEIHDPETVRRFRERLRGDRAPDPSLPLEFAFNLVRPGRRVLEIKPLVLELLAGARDTVTILMAYIGDRDVSREIAAAARRGVAVTLVLPARANIQPDYNLRILRDICRNCDGALAIHLCPDMLHAKLLAFDDTVFLLGSANLNTQALARLSELDVLLRDPAPSLRDQLQAATREIIDASPGVRRAEEIRFNPIRAWLESLVA